MSFRLCRICQRPQVERLISIHCRAGRQQKAISDMLNDVRGSKMEEDDRLPQKLCIDCFKRLDQAYSLRMEYRRSLRTLLLNPAEGTISRCLICSATNDEKELSAMDYFKESWKMKISDMIEHLIGEQIKDRSLKYTCSSCLIELDFAYEFRRKCLDSEINLLQKVSYPWERMDVDDSNPKQLTIDLFAEVVQVGKGKAECSICRLAVDLEQIGKKCEGCKLEFRKRATVEAKGDSGEGKEEETSEQEYESCSDTESLRADTYSSKMEFVAEEENEQQLDAHVEEDSEDELFEMNFPKLPKPNSEHVGYVDEPEKLFDIIEQYPDDPFPTILRKGPCCCKCFKFFATKSELADHQAESHAASTGSGQFSCDVCLTLYDKEQALEEHRKSLDTFVYQFCRSCLLVLESPRLYREHKLMYHMDLNAIKEAESNFEKEIVVSYNCCVLHCYNRYSSEEQLQKHLKVAHGQEEKSVQEETCQYCEGVFSSKANLLNHWRFAKEKYRCRVDGCNYMRSNKSTMWQHCSENPHVKEFNETKTLVPDMKHFTVIGELDSRTNILLRECRFCCRCFLCFETKEELTAHCELHKVEGNQPFPCEICGRRFTKVGLSLHSRLQEIPTNYYCRPCKTFLWRKIDYVNHKITNHLYDDDLSDKIKTEEDHSFTCCGCWKAFQMEDQLIEHRKKHHPPVKSKGVTKAMLHLKCDYCHQFMGSMELLERHITFYESGVSHSCKMFGCAFKTKDMDQMRRHIFYGTHRDPSGNIIGLKSNGPDNYRCCVRNCYFRCLDYDIMIEHGQVEHADRREQLSICRRGQFSCPVCCKGFDQPITLYRHKHSKKKRRCRGCQKEFHQDMYQVHVSQCTETLKCEICDRVMCSKVALQKHLSVIHSVKQESETTELSICNICGKRVKKINQHMMLHANKRIWKCLTCGARFNTSGTLKKHELTHRNERNFPCRQGCDKRYKGSGDRDRHEKSVHLGIKPFVCTICGESFIRDRDLRLHGRKHTGLKLYPCSICRASFDKLSEYEEHCTEHVV